MSQKFLKALRNRPYLILDGAMGTLLQKENLLSKDVPPELLNITHFDTISEIHKEYLTVGADIIETNTFGGNRIKLGAFEMSHRVAELVQAGVKCAQEAVKDNPDKFIALSVGPTGKLLEPLGDLSFDEAYSVFYEQIKAGVDSGVDLVLIETMSDFQEVKAAVIAAKDAGADAIVVSMTFEPDGKTITGINAKAAVAYLQSLGLAAFGSNCSTGPDKMLENVVKPMTSLSPIPLIFYPNAGMPQLIDGQTVFALKPEEHADFAATAVSLGARIVGGCCGTTPDHIKAVAEELSKLQLQNIQRPKYYTMFTSRTRTVQMNESFKFLVIGERINPNARKAVRQSLEQNKLTALRKEALAQAGEGAEMLDINVSVPNIDEPSVMRRAIFSIQNIIDIPISIDSPNTKAIEEGLKAFAGRPLINSVNAKDSSIEAIIPLAAKYGAALIALPLDENGIPPTAEQRIKLAEKIVTTAEKYGIRHEDIFVDGITLTVSSNPESAIETLRTIQMAKQNLGTKTVLGLSNISFGLPNRKIINKTFLTMAIAYGLDAAIINPALPELREIIDAAAVLLNKRDAVMHFIQKYGGGAQAPASPLVTQTGDKEKLSPEKRLYNAVLTGDTENITEFVELCLKNNSPLDITNNILIPAIREVGDLYDKGTYFLPQLIMSGDAMHKAFAILRPFLKKDNVQQSEKVVIATVEGDIHDIGKNIVGVMLENYGFEVIDLGKNVPAQKILDAALEHNVKVVGLSALMTTTMPEMKRFIELKNKVKPQLKVAIGGAAVTQKYADEIGADGYAPDAIAAAKLFQRLVSS